MSTTSPTDAAGDIDYQPTDDVTPVRLAATDLASTAPEYLRDLKHDLTSAGLAPTELTVEARFDEDCSLRTQAVADHVRSYVRAAAFLGAGTLTVRCETVANEEKARPALEALAERARREGVALECEGAVAL